MQKIAGNRCQTSSKYLPQPLGFPFRNCPILWQDLGCPKYLNQSSAMFFILGQSGVQYQLTASTASTQTPTSYTGSLIYDVIKLGTLKRKGGKIYLHFLVFSLVSMGTIKQDHERCSGSCDFHMRATLENGDVWRHMIFVDVWLLWPLGLRVDPVDVVIRQWMPLRAKIYSQHPVSPMSTDFPTLRTLSLCLFSWMQGSIVTDNETYPPTLTDGICGKTDDGFLDISEKYKLEIASTFECAVICIISGIVINTSQYSPLSLCLQSPLISLSFPTLHVISRKNKV